MPIITISRGSYSKGKEVAELVAQRLGYRIIDRDDMIEEASEEFNIPEIKLVRAIHDAPSILDRFTYGKERFRAYFRSALLERLENDNVIYHGLAGHFFLHGVSHVLKIRIIADMEDRVRLEMEREGIGYKEALHLLQKDDEERRKWSLNLYGIDTKDPALYDLVIHIKKITVSDVVDIICHAANLGHFQATPESTMVIKDLLLAARTKSALIQLAPDIEVSAKNGVVHIKAKELVSQQGKLLSEIKKAAEGIPGLKDIEIEIKPITP